jgi:serine/threonine-protein kinase
MPDPARSPDRETVAGKTEGLDRPAEPGQIGQTFGRYEEVQFLGNGGMGIVFKAQDPTLGRKVALKLIRGTDENLANRLLMEAKAQARIEHENVCRVYDAGVQAGRPYIAMQLIEGRSLPLVCDELSLEQKLQVMRDVAVGVHAAHRAGLVHRDLKPSNIMVERQEDGRLHPYVMDFGIARDVEAPGATVTGIVLGTPWYMSPEQARGGQLDRRTDVYALGATLYDVLAGEPPFGREANATSVVKLLSEEAPPLRKHNPALPRDVETIVMKCLEKDPSRRYDSARALADDIDRFLDGEPLAARPPSLAYRLYTKARKNRTAVAIGAVATLLVCALGIAALRERAAARRQFELASEFSGIVKDVEWRMRVAHLAPLHDTVSEKTRVKEDLGRIEARMRAVGGLAQGPGEYALGRGQLALEKWEAARVHLEKAWASGYRGPEVAYALGRALGEIYKKERLLADGIGNKLLRESKQREVKEALRDPAVSYLRQGGGGDVASPAYVQALLALYEERFPDALTQAAAVREQAPWLYEARLVEGDVHSKESQSLHEQGNEAASQKAVEDAEAAYREAANYARSDPAAYEGLCQMGLQRMEATVYAKGDLAPLYDAAQRACATALQADSERAEAYAKLSNIHRFWADHLARTGGDPGPTLKRAAEAGQRALAFDPDSRRAHGNLGIIYRLQAANAESHGQEDHGLLEAAFASLQRAVELSGGDAPSVNDLGNAYSTRATAVANRGGDPRGDLTLAVEQYDRALAKVPDFGYAHANRGIVLSDKGRYEMEHGIDPGASLEAALGSLGRSAELLPQLTGIHTALADTYLLRARFEREQGRDPSKDIASAHREVDLARGPKADPDVEATTGRVLLAEAEHRFDTGASTEDALRSARTSFSDAAKGDPGSSDAPVGVGRVELLAARAGKGDPAEALGRASAAFGDAAKKNPKDLEAYLGAARVELLRADRKIAAGRTPDPEVASGLGAIDRALSLQPGQAAAFLLKGELLTRSALGSSDPEARRQAATRADEALGKAVAINAFLSKECEAERQRLGASH